MCADSQVQFILHGPMSRRMVRPRSATTRLNRGEVRSCKGARVMSDVLRFLGRFRVYGEYAHYFPA